MKLSIMAIAATAAASLLVTGVAWQRRADATEAIRVAETVQHYPYRPATVRAAPYAPHACGGTGALGGAAIGAATGAAVGAATRPYTGGAARGAATGAAIGGMAGGVNRAVDVSRGCI